MFKMHLSWRNMKKTTPILLVTLVIFASSMSFAEDLFAPHVDYETGAYSRAVVTGDFNSDGEMDIATANSGTVSILIGNGDGTFQPKIDFGASAYPYFSGYCGF